MKPSIEEAKNEQGLRKLSVLIVIIYLCLTVAFYYLADQQLHLRKSRHNIDMAAANSGSIELSAGSKVEQVFINKIQRLKTISIAWGTYDRTNSGTICIELFDLQTDSLLLHQELSAAEISDGFISTFVFENPKEDLVGSSMLLRITADSNPGSAVSPLMNTAASEEGFLLLLNGQPALGMLCFSVQGEEYIWTGLHYWKFVIVGALLLVGYLGISIYNVKKGKSSILFTGVTALKKYHFLIKQLVSRDFKVKYKRSILGVLWSFLNPLLTMMVQYLVFSNLFRFDIKYYPVYLICGIVMFNYLSESCGMTLNSIVGNANLITKVYVPKYIYPLSRVLSSFINLLISLMPLFIVSLLSGIHPSKAYLLLPFVLLCLAVFCLGIGMFLAALMVFFRDIQFLWGIISMIWMYGTPIFYPETILPPKVAMILKANPMYYFIKFVRTCVIEGVSPEPIMYVQCFLFALSAFMLGALVFKKTQDKFVLYI